MIMLVTTFIVLMAAMVQGMVGFGFSLIAVPLLSMVLPVQSVVPMVVCYSLINNLMIAGTIGRAAKPGKILPMIVFGIMGIPFGVRLLIYTDGTVLRQIMGVLIVITSLAMIFGFKIAIHRERLALCVAGFTSGFLNGSLSMSGPPIVLFMSNQAMAKDTFRANLAVYASVTNVVTIGTLLINGLIPWHLVSVMAMNAMGLIAGTAIGMTASSRIRETYFRRTVLALMTIIGIMTIININ